MPTTTTYEEFISAVRETAHIPGDEAERAACATLQTLSERISSGETSDIAERLPDQLRSCLSPADDFAPFHADEFLRRVSERASLDAPAAERDASAVFSALFRTVGPEEFHDLRSELPEDFDPLLDEALHNEPVLGAGEPEAAQPAVTADEFVGRVADRARIDRERAWRATEAVLATLAIRLTGGEVEDLAARLASQLRVPLEWGLAEGGRAARPLTVDEFLGEIARREDVDRGQATEHARAVFATLREAVGEKEFEDMRDQLPGEYGRLLRPEATR
jgi:uncharacterized protein (DUF2267 family)